MFYAIRKRKYIMRVNENTEPAAQRQHGPGLASRMTRLVRISASPDPSAVQDGLCSGSNYHLCSSCVLGGWCASRTTNDGVHARLSTSSDHLFWAWWTPLYLSVVQTTLAIRALLLYKTNSR